MVQKENGIQLHYEKYRKIIQGLTLMSDALIRNVLRDIKCAEYVIQIIMEQADLKIVDVTSIRDGIREDFLKKDRVEVMKVSIYEYDAQKHIEMERGEL